MEITPTQLEQSLLLAKDVATLAGKEILKIYQSKALEQHTKKDNSPVTQADIAANKIIVSELTKRSKYPVLSEEGAPQALNTNGTYWVIDPLDGTKNFISRDSDFSVMLGLLHNGQPIMGVVYVPVLDELYYASQNNGAFVKRTIGTTVTTIQLHTDKEKKYESYIALLSKNHLKPQEVALVSLLNIAQSIQRGSSGIKLALISGGNADFYVNLDGLSVWDICGPAAILLEAGGSLYDKSGAQLDYTKHSRLENGIIATNGNSAFDKQIKNALRQMMRK